MTSASAVLGSELGHLVEKYQREGDPNLSLAMFRLLGWEGNDFRLEPGRADELAQQYRLAVAGETTAYLFVASREPREDLFRNAANVAYNSGVDWAAVTNFATTRLLHARWSDNPTYITLEWKDYQERLQELELLSPKSMIEGRLTEGAREVERERKVLEPVDQHLMNRLESWRRLLLRHSGDVTDEQVHELIGRLFFIRSCEDRGIVPRDSLLTICSRVTVSFPLGRQLNQLFARLGADFDSELFVDRDGVQPTFDDVVLGEIIQDLYSPFRGLPHYRYDFSYLNVDVLGKVYERYVSTVLERAPKAEQMQARLFDFGGTEQEVETRSKRREQGIYYTPPYIVNYIVQHTVEHLLEEARTLNEFPRVADISCGSGGFLTRAAERMAARAREIDQGTTDSNWRRRVVTLLHGVDADARAVTLARVNLWILTTMGEPPRPLPELGASVIAADALTAPEVDALKGQLDAVVGNPPFRSAAELDRVTQEQLRRRYKSAAGRFDIAYVFMERALQLVRPGGYVGLVLPNRLFTNADARFLRDLLAEAVTIEKVVDFGHVRAFDEGLSYTTILIVRKSSQSTDEGTTHANAADDAARAQVHRVIRRAEYPGLQLRRADLVSGTEWQDEYSQVFTAPQPRNSGPWIWWASDIDDRIHQKLAADGTPLSDVAEVHQGVKTGDNRIFILKRVGTNARTGRWVMQNGLGDRVEIEPDLLRPCVYGNAIDRYIIREHASEGPMEYVLYPYQRRRILDPFELQAAFPATYSYLLKYRGRLLDRRTVRSEGLWYDLSRARAEAWLDQPKLLTRVLVPEATFAADEGGQYAPIGGTALLPRDSGRISLYLLLGVLNSSVMTWYLAYRAAHFQRGYSQIAPGELKAFQFPWDLLLAEDALARRVEMLVAGAADAARLGLSMTEAVVEIDATLFDILGLDAVEQQAVLDRTSRRSYEPEEPYPQLLWTDASPSTSEHLALVDRLLARAEVSDSRRGQEEALTRARDELFSMLNSSSDGMPELARSLLTFALLGAEHLSQGPPVRRQQLALLRELVNASRGSTLAPEALARFAHRLLDEGIQVLPNMARASMVMTASSDEAEDDIGLLVPGM